MDYTCEFCEATKCADDMAILDPVIECRDCADAEEFYWAGQYSADAHTHDLAGCYELDDPKHPEWAERLMERAGV